MGIFNREPIVEIVGVIDRVGAISTQYHSYLVQIQGDDRLFDVWSRTGVEPEHGMRLARIGDRVAIGIRGNAKGRQKAYIFRNLTMIEGH